MGPENTIRVRHALGEDGEVRKGQALLDEVLRCVLKVEDRAVGDDVAVGAVAGVDGLVEGVVVRAENGEGDYLSVACEEAEEALEVIFGLEWGLVDIRREM